MVLILGHFRQQTRNTWKILKCGAGELWGRSIELIMLRRENYYNEMGDKEHPTYNKEKKG